MRSFERKVTACARFALVPVRIPKAIVALGLAEPAVEECSGREQSVGRIPRTSEGLSPSSR